MKTLIITVSLVLNINTILAQKYAINHGLDIPLLDQLLTKDSAACWLYCATMIHSWKHQTSFSLIEVGNFATHNSKAKYNYLKRYIKRNKNGEQLGLPFSKTTDFAEAMGWQPLLQSPGVSNIFEILQTHGPIVFFHNPNPEILNNTNGHVMLIVGIRFDDPNYGDYTFLEVYDPWHGKNYEITFSDYEKFYLTASAKLQNYLFHY